MTGMKTLSSKFPWLAAIPKVASLPMTWTATMVTASHCVGLTLLGMMELPGSFSGMRISPMPQRGPDDSQRMSLAIFMRSQAKALSIPWTTTSSSLLVRDWNLFGAVWKVVPVSWLTISAKRTS